MAHCPATQRFLPSVRAAQSVASRHSAQAVGGPLTQKSSSFFPEQGRPAFASHWQARAVHVAVKPAGHATPHFSHSFVEVFLQVTPLPREQQSSSAAHPAFVATLHCGGLPTSPPCPPVVAPPWLVTPAAPPLLPIEPPVPGPPPLVIAPPLASEPPFAGAPPLAPALPPAPPLAENPAAEPVPEEILAPPAPPLASLFASKSVMSEQAPSKAATATARDAQGTLNAS